GSPTPTWTGFSVPRDHPNHERVKSVLTVRAPPRVALPSGTIGLAQCRGRACPCPARHPETEGASDNGTLPQARPYSLHRGDQGGQAASAARGGIVPGAARPALPRAPPSLSPRPVRLRRVGPPGNAPVREPTARPAPMGYGMVNGTDVTGLTPPAAPPREAKFGHAGYGAGREPAHARDSRARGKTRHDDEGTRMQELRLVAVSEDGTYLVLATPG